MNHWKAFLQTAAKVAVEEIETFLAVMQISYEDFAVTHCLPLTLSSVTAEQTTEPVLDGTPRHVLTQYAKQDENALGLLGLIGAQWQCFETETGLAFVIRPHSLTYRETVSVKSAERLLRKDLLGRVTSLVPDINVEAADCSLLSSLPGVELVRQPDADLVFELRKK